MVSATSTGDPLKWATAILGAIVAATTGLTQMFKYLEEWILYNNAQAALANELNLYSMNSGDYKKLPNQSDKDSLFVDRIEAKILELQTKLGSTHSKAQLSQFMGRFGGGAPPGGGALSFGG